MRHFILVFVLLLMLNPYAGAGRTAKLWRIIANVTAEKDGDTCYEVVESMAYSWNKKISHATGSNKLSLYKSIHQYDIIPFFEAIISKHKKALPIKPSHISYRCQHARQMAKLPKKADWQQARAGEYCIRRARFVLLLLACKHARCCVLQHV